MKRIFALIVSCCLLISTSVYADYAQPGPYGIDSYKVARGELILPQGFTEKAPFIIIGHGFSSSPAHQVGFAKHLASYGFAAFAMQTCSGFFCSPDPKTMTKKIQSTLAELADEKLPAAAQGRIDFDRIGMQGHSAGGQAFTVAAADLQPKTLVLLDPVPGGANDKDTTLVSAALPKIAAPTMTLYAESEGKVGTCNKNGVWQSIPVQGSGLQFSATVTNSVHCDGELPRRGLCTTFCSAKSVPESEGTIKEYLTRWFLAYLAEDKTALDDFAAELFALDTRLRNVKFGKSRAFTIPKFPKARPDTAPVLPNPYKGCGPHMNELSEDELFACAEEEFWIGFSDGRLKERQKIQDRLGQIMDLTKQSSNTAKKGRIYALRGYLRLALALENGRINHLLFGSLESDFKQAKSWDSTNKTYDTFLDTIIMAKSAVFGDWDKAVAYALPSFKILEDVPVNILALSGTTIGFPMDTGVPQKTIEYLDNFKCTPELASFCYENTLHAPYARPGLSFHFAEAYARVGDEAKALHYMQLAKDSPDFEAWAYKDLVLKPLADFPAYMKYWKAFKSNDSLIDKVYANQNYGCVMCHGR